MSLAAVRVTIDRSPEARVPFERYWAIGGSSAPIWYDAGHGFNCNDRGSYNAEAARLAKERSPEFLQKHLV